MSMLLAACETMVSDIPEAKLPKGESRLVVNSFISPQLSYINVIVTESIPLFTKSDATGNKIENATVRISDGVNEVTIPFDPKNKLYSIPQSKFPISASKTYYLSVSDGKRSVTAQCTVPKQTPVIKSYEIDTVIRSYSLYQDTAVTLKMTWQDFPKDTNYYRVSAFMDIDYTVPVATDKQDFTEKRISGTYDFNWNWQTGRNELISDNKLDGSVFTSPIGRASLPHEQEKTSANGKKVIIYPHTKITAINMEIYSVDKHYYKYFRSQTVSDNTDNPFSEPALIYTNIKGGLGCFGAYNAAQLKHSYTK
ncbi:DUF4249 domain-containing protein [Dyadobacter flavalbus]|uniref:DUF4249 domain-containing protein n=2 Tax=Dyadobacter flavalbus TaxID=2579942 RepID=A0A5M8QQ61_9BACT|nr:DUF4249 domain-containing protein [Dyadobacter flavalbus]